MKTRPTLMAICFLLLATLALASCGDDKKNEAPTNQTPVSVNTSGDQTAAMLEWKDLANRSFVLTKMNNENFVQVSKTPTIKFNETPGISGNICNSFTGKATLENSVLKGANMAATKMLCDEALNTLEGEFFKALSEDGLKINLADKNLTLSNATLTLQYTEQ